MNDYSITIMNNWITIKSLNRINARKNRRKNKLIKIFNI